MPKIISHTLNYYKMLQLWLFPQLRASIQVHNVFILPCLGMNVCGGNVYFSQLRCDWVDLKTFVRLGVCRLFVYIRRIILSCAYSYHSLWLIVGLFKHLNSSFCQHLTCSSDMTSHSEWDQYLPMIIKYATDDCQPYVTHMEGLHFPFTINWWNYTFNVNVTLQLASGDGILRL